MLVATTNYKLDVQLDTNDLESPSKQFQDYYDNRNAKFGSYQRQDSQTFKQRGLVIIQVAIFYCSHRQVAISGDSVRKILCLMYYCRHHSPSTKPCYEELRLIYLLYN